MTAIEWTDETWNPTLGCERVSPGCDGCYAIRQSRMRAGNPHPAIAAAHAGLTTDADGRLDWTGTVRTLPSRLEAPLHWRRPRRVFVDSLSDLFHDDVPDEFIGSVFEVMAQTPQHTYQILTKRHGRMRSLLTRFGLEGERHPWAGPGTAVFRRNDLGWVGPIPWPLPNVWLGVSVEDQQRADLRIPALLQTPAAVRFLSCEPLLGAVDLRRAVNRLDWLNEAHWRPGGIDWVIAGGESGPGARPMHPDWARGLRDQCSDSDVPYFYKQAGDWELDAPRDAATHLVQTDGRVIERTTPSLGYGTTAPTPQDLVDRGHPGWSRTRRIGKRRAGRELDGRTHDAFPEVSRA